MKGQNNKNLGVYSIALAAILWSTAGVAFKYIQWHPIAIAGLRSLIAFAVLLIYWIHTNGSCPPLPIGRKLLAAINYAVMVFLFIGANKLTTAANAILLQFTSPIWVMLFAAFFLKEKIKKIDILTVACVLVGMSLFFMGELQPGTLLGNAMAILSGVAMAIMVVSLKGVKVGSPLEIILWGNLLTAVAALPFYHRIIWTTDSLLAISFLGLIQLGLSYVLYTKGITAVTALEGILFSVLEPLFSPFWVFLLLGEAPSPYALIGGAIVILSIIAGSVVKNRASSLLSG